MREYCENITQRNVCQTQSLINVSMDGKRRKMELEEAGTKPLSNVKGKITLGVKEREHF